MANFPDQFRRPYAPRWHGDRETRHAALRTVFQILNCGTLKRRKETWRWLAHSAENHDREKRMMEGFDRKALKKWLKKVDQTAVKLADLLESLPAQSASDFVLRRMLGNMEQDPRKFIDELRALAATAADERTIPGAHWKGRTPNSPINALVQDLALLYTTYTGQRPKRCTYADNYGDHPERHGEPGGPFHRFVTAVLALIGESMTPRQIDTAIRHHAASPFDRMDKRDGSG